jgi:phosphoribosylformylglycinamidine cyclo-ligase
MAKKAWSYRRAGVDIDAGDALVERIKKRVPEIGDFAGLFPFPTGMKKPMLVGCCDGVGTKLKLAQDMGIHNTIGKDLVAMNVNDMICSGARPLFFLDYYASGRLDLKTAGHVVDGIIDACKESNCVLLGGETAEMPGMYPEGEYDLAGFAVGVVDKEKRVRNDKIKAGDILLGLPSSGIHSNGYSLVRRLFKKKDYKKWGKILLEPTRIYVKTILAVLRKFPGAVNGIAHITGSGLTENVPRFLPKNLDALIFRASWPVPDVFAEMQRRGNVDEAEMFRTFNMGIGMALAVSRKDADKVQKFLAPCHRLGRIVKGRQAVRYS